MKTPEFLFGIGQDSHRFDTPDSKKPLVLGGYTVEDHIGLKGNSDADVVLHALFNAISLAVGKKSLGFYSDPMCKERGITNSDAYLKVALKLMDNAGYKVSNVTIMLECKTPNIEKNRKGIVSSVAQILDIEKSRVGLAGTTGEEMTAFGKGEGIQCFCSVALEKKTAPFYKKPVFIITVIVLLGYLLILNQVMDTISGL